MPPHAQRMDSLLAADREFVDCRESKGGRVRCGRGARREAGGPVGRRRRKRHAQGWADSRLGGQGTCGAHLEHGGYGCDLGGVKAQRLVERRRELPSR